LIRIDSDWLGLAFIDAHHYFHTLRATCFPGYRWMFAYIDLDLVGSQKVSVAAVLW
jgi:hypothetical protein